MRSCLATSAPPGESLRLAGVGRDGGVPFPDQGLSAALPGGNAWYVIPTAIERSPESRQSADKALVLGYRHVLLLEPHSLSQQQTERQGRVGTRVLVEHV